MQEMWIADPADRPSFHSACERISAALGLNDRVTQMPLRQQQQQQQRPTKGPPVAFKERNDVITAAIQHACVCVAGAVGGL